VATSTPEHIFPSTANAIQDWLGAKYAGAYDLSAACSGFVYALDMASAKIRAGDIDNALIIGAETMSRVLNWSDRGTCILFGDGAGAVVLSASSDPGGILSSVLRSDGSGGNMLALPTVGSEAHFRNNGHLHEGNEEHQLHRLYMNGREVFRFATRVVNESIKEALRLADLTLEEVDLIIPHQANQRIIESAARSLKLPTDKFFSNVARYGNTSAASIPIALYEAVEHGLVHPDDTLVLVGFGGGLTWGSMVIKWQTEPVKPQPITGIRRQVTYWYANQRRNIVRTWRRVYNAMAGSPTSATMKHLRKNLEHSDWETEPDKEKM
jgi:3-oxoacyl-[acyl-carrier-protein] synthase-3